MTIVICLCYTSCGSLAGTINSSVDLPRGIDPTTHITLSNRCSTELLHVPSSTKTGCLFYDTPVRRVGQRGMKNVNQYGRKEGKEGNVLFNDALNTFYLRLHGVRHMVKDHSARKETRHEVSIRRPIAPWSNTLTTELHLAPWINMEGRKKMFF